MEPGRRKILIEDYNPDWAVTFQQLSAVYQSFLKEFLADIQHVGSTSVPGLAAKPIIDIDLVLADIKKLHPVIEKLGSLGYQHLGDLGIAGREAFQRKSDAAPLDGSGRTWAKHNLYVCAPGCVSFKNHIALRDLLRNNPAKAKEYGELKKKLVSEHPYNIDMYTEGKTSFILAILREAGFDQEMLDDIERANKAKDP